MTAFPKATEVQRRIPKEAFYRHLTLTQAQKDKFVSDVERIVIENSLTNDSLHFSTTAEIHEILVLSVFLKKQDFDGKIIECIARQNPHKLLFQLVYEDRRQLALYHNRLYRTAWKKEDEINVSLQGFSLDELWNSFVEQIALYEETAENTDSLTLNERLALQSEIEKYEKLIQKTEKAVYKEQQPKKKFTLYTQLREYKKKLENLKNGKT
ncbi:MAG: DUF4391 domain-containing protein [Clostridia bacterium]|nr:DUF4391 domain-containing protein [Clostridia bacterium]